MAKKLHKSIQESTEIVSEPEKHCRKPAACQFVKVRKVRKAAGAGRVQIPAEMGVITTVKECDKKNVPHQESNLGPAT